LFQGQEHDDEINGSVGTSYAFEYRMHDPRVGRFLSIDPLAAKYPWNSPYAFAENKVIQFIELEGLETATPPMNVGPYTPDEMNPERGGGTGGSAMGTAPSPQLGFVGVPVLPMGSPSPTTAPSPTPNTLPRPGPPGVAPSIGLRSLGVIGAMLAPTPTGDLISPQEQQQLFQQFKQDEDDKQLVTLFRGVANNVPTNSFQYEAALFGMAVPRGMFDKNPHMSMEDHTFGFTESSLFTSWSLQESVAADFASRGQLGGVVLSKQFPKSVLRQQSALGVSSFKEEHEILIMGVQRGAQVRLLH
jgi:RHS repeat-associated protein